MAECKNPDCDNTASQKGWYCRKCYDERKKGKEVSQNQVWLEAIKKAKQEHVIFIAYFFAVCILFGSYGWFIKEVDATSHWYGGFYTIALFIAILIPAIVIGFQLWNEREIIKLEREK